MQTRLRLVDGSDELLIWQLDDPAETGVYTQKLDISSPAAREVVEDRPDADGTDDDTQYHGAASVTLELTFFDQPAALLDALKPWLRFSRRPYLCLSDDEWPTERRMRLRADQWSAPIDHVGLGRWREVQVQWKAPDGVWVASDPTAIVVDAQAQTKTGISFPRAFPWTFTATAGIGQVSHTNAGSEPAHQIVKLYGPCSGPRWTCDTTGDTIAFTEGLTIPAGDYVEVDTANRTAYYLSDPGASRLGYLDYALSSWWRIPVGPSVLRYNPVSGVDAGCQAQATYSPTFLP